MHFADFRVNRSDAQLRRLFTSASLPARYWSPSVEDSLPKGIVTHAGQALLDESWIAPHPKSVIYVHHDLMPSSALPALARCLLCCGLTVAYTYPIDLLDAVNAKFTDDLSERDILIIDYLFDTNVWESFDKRERLSLLNYLEHYVQEQGMFITRSNAAENVLLGDNGMLATFIHTYVDMVTII